MGKVKASQIIPWAERALKEHWAYVPGAARIGEVDCSGLFALAYSKCGGYMPHGSNSMYRKYSTETGKIGEITLVPGMAVYRWSPSGSEPDWCKGDGIGDMHHVGMYVGNGKCIEAKGTKYGVVESKIEKWDYASRLKNTIYDVGSDSEASGADEGKGSEIMAEAKAIVNTENGTLNLRSKPSKTAIVLARIPKGETVDVLEASNGWARVSYKGSKGYVAAEYLDTASEAQNDGTDEGEAIEPTSDGSRYLWHVCIPCETLQEAEKLADYFSTSLIRQVGGE